MRTLGGQEQMFLAHTCLFGTQGGCPGEERQHLGDDWARGNLPHARRQRPTNDAMRRRLRGETATDEAAEKVTRCYPIDA